LCNRKGKQRWKQYSKTAAQFYIKGELFPKQIIPSKNYHIKKTALRPFSFERAGGPPPSVFFALNELISFCYVVSDLVFSVVLGCSMFDFPFLENTFGEVFQPIVMQI
jgi:hypothetical protein